VSIFSIVLIILTTVLSKKRAQRIREEVKRWKEVKELEEDYDVYVSDEYAYHIADSKLQMHQIQDLGIANLD
jgi:ATP:corrinoid adenosyltransferase